MMMKMFKGIIKKTKNNNMGNPPEFPKVYPDNALSVSKRVQLVPHFVYSNSENMIIGSIYLTEEQAYNLNEIMRYKGANYQNIVFLRK